MYTRYTYICIYACLLSLSLSAIRYPLSISRMHTCAQQRPQATRSSTRLSLSLRLTREEKLPLLRRAEPRFCTILSGMAAHTRAEKTFLLPFPPRALLSAFRMESGLCCYCWMCRRPWLSSYYTTHLRRIAHWQVARGCVCVRVRVRVRARCLTSERKWIEEEGGGKKVSSLHCIARASLLLAFIFRSAVTGVVCLWPIIEGER
jgi:hypothetical protein